MRTNPLLLLCILSMLLFSCDKKENPEISKVFDSDFFKSTMVESQFVDIDLSKDNVFKSKKGNMVLVPAGAFLNSKGEPVEGNVSLEIAEADQADELILSNLVLQEPGKILETHTSFFVNATKDGEQLSINPEVPVYIELASDKALNLYKGERDEEGNMKWTAEENTIKYLSVVPLELLNFYPAGFESVLYEALPFRGHKTASSELKDSLLYALNFIYAGCTKENSKIPQPPTEGLEVPSDTINFPCSVCGVDPVSIKTIRTKKFENTLISTREFEERLQSIYKTCDNDILELYVNNLDKNMFEIDALVAKKLKDDNNDLHKTFTEYASRKQTKVKLSDKRAAVLANYYKKQKQQFTDKLSELHKEKLEAEKKQSEFTLKKIEEYQGLLAERQEYRMNKFGFNLTKMGWYSAVKEVYVSELDTFNLEVNIDNGAEHDRAYVYIINPNIKSVFSMISFNNINFNSVYAEDSKLLLWKNQEFKIIGVGFKGSSISFEVQQAKHEKEVKSNLNLQKSDIKSFKKAIRDYTKGYKKENSIIVDLEYQALFYKEKKRREQKYLEEVLMIKLYMKINPCCDLNYWIEPVIFGK